MLDQSNSLEFYRSHVSIMLMNHYLYKQCVLLLGVAAFCTRVCAEQPVSPFDNGRFVQIDNVQVHVRDWSSSEAETNTKTDACPVMLIHGFAGSSFSFRELAPALSKAGHQVLTIDLPGYGYSERKPFTGTAAAALWALAEREQPNKKWCLLGHSMGAKLAGQMAALKPQQVKAIAYLDGSPLLSSERRKKWFARSSLVRKTMVKWVETFYLNEKKFAEVLGTAYGRKPTAMEVQGYLQPLLLPNTADALFGGYAKQWSNDTNPEQIAEIPTVIIWGAQDKWIKPEVGKTLAKKLPKAGFLLVDGAGHCPLETHFQIVLPAIQTKFSNSLMPTVAPAR
jgi:pimeloyl-ACP methyl ester carboxylesterase